jgi:hypothetical protein
MSKTPSAGSAGATFERIMKPRAHMSKTPPAGSAAVLAATPGLLSQTAKSINTDVDRFERLNCSTRRIVVGRADAVSSW